MTGRVSTTTLTLLLIHAVTTAQAQSALGFTPSLSVGQIYDSNLFSTAEDRQSDIVTRITSGVEATHRSTVLTLLGACSLDVERFSNHPQLTSMDARQHARISVGYRGASRMVMEAGAEVWKTRTPGELNAETGLTFTRAAARRLTAHSSLTRRFSPVSSGTARYTVTQDRLRGDGALHTHAATVEAERRLSSRNTVRVGYRFYRFLFGGHGASAFSTGSQVIGAGWNRSVTPHVSLSLDGGPRLSGGSFTPELSASVHYHSRTADVSFVYTRTQATLIGLASTTHTESVASPASWNLGRSLQMRIVPGFFQNASGGRHADAYVLSLGIAYVLAQNLSLDVAFDGAVQRGSLYAVVPNSVIPRRGLAIRLVAAPATRPR